MIEFRIMSLIALYFITALLFVFFGYRTLTVLLIACSAGSSVILYSFAETSMLWVNLGAYAAFSCGTAILCLILKRSISIKILSFRHQNLTDLRTIESRLLSRTEEMEKAGLIRFCEGSVSITYKGRTFLVLLKLLSLIA